MSLLRGCRDYSGCGIGCVFNAVKQVLCGIPVYMVMALIGMDWCAQRQHQRRARLGLMSMTQVHFQFPLPLHAAGSVRAARAGALLPDGHIQRRHWPGACGGRVRSLVGDRVAPALFAARTNRRPLTADRLAQLVVSYLRCVFTSSAVDDFIVPACVRRRAAWPRSRRPPDRPTARADTGPALSRRRAP
jgi:hypothetical protein